MQIYIVPEASHQIFVVAINETRKWLPSPSYFNYYFYYFILFIYFFGLGMVYDFIAMLLKWKAIYLVTHIKILSSHVKFKALRMNNRFI